MQADLDNGVCQLSAGHAPRESSSCVPVCDICNQLQPKLAGVEDALQDLQAIPQASSLFIACVACAYGSPVSKQILSSNSSMHISGRIALQLRSKPSIIKKVSRAPWRTWVLSSWPP